MSQERFPSASSRFHPIHRVKDHFFLHFLMDNRDHDGVTHLDLKGLIYSHGGTVPKINVSESRVIKPRTG